MSCLIGVVPAIGTLVIIAKEITKDATKEPLIVLSGLCQDTCDDHSAKKSQNDQFLKTNKQFFLNFFLLVLLVNMTYHGGNSTETG